MPINNCGRFVKRPVLIGLTALALSVVLCWLWSGGGTTPLAEQIVAGRMKAILAENDFGVGTTIISFPNDASNLQMLLERMATLSEELTQYAKDHPPDPPGNSARVFSIGGDVLVDDAKTPEKHVDDATEDEDGAPGG